MVDGFVPCRVRRVHASGRSVPVYDLTVQDSHEFFAGGMLVHNSVALACWYHERGGNRVIFYVPDPNQVQAEIAAAAAYQPPEEPLIAEHTPEEIEAEIKRVLEKEKQDFWKKLAGEGGDQGFVDGWKDWR